MNTINFTKAERGNFQLWRKEHFIIKVNKKRKNQKDCNRNPISDAQGKKRKKKKKKKENQEVPFKI
jgi:hypothetical protein